MELVLVRRGRVYILSLVSKGVFPFEVGKCSKEGDPEYECVGPGKVAVLLGWSVGLIEKVTSEGRCEGQEGMPTRRSGRSSLQAEALQ